MEQLKAPFPWFGGKSRVAHIVWERFGDVPNYVEPFFGSGAVLLGRPHEPKIETVNDLDGFVCNAWRAIKSAPEETAKWADNPVNECDLHARHVWLKDRRDELSARLMGDPEYYDAKIAGWWLWGMAVWIGGGFCGPSGAGPWGVVDGKLVHLGDAGQGVARKRVHLGDAGRGVARKRVHLGNAGQGVKRQRVHLGNAGQGVSRRRVHLGKGRGVSRRRVHLGDAGQGVARNHGGLVEWFEALAARLARVRVCCGDWARVCGASPTFKHGVTGVFLDPPYSAEASRSECYSVDDFDVAHAVREWCEANGDNPLLRIALCGYESEGHDHLVEMGWTCVPWKTHGGYGNKGEDARGRDNAHRERIWFSPHCLQPDLTQPALFEAAL